MATSMASMLMIFLFLLLHGIPALSSRPIDEQDAAMELDANTFNSSLWAAPARWAMVEFYAHCPSPLPTKPQYERVARLFNGQNAAHPGVVYMAKVDCALKGHENLNVALLTRFYWMAVQLNAPLCDRFKIGHYPTLLWGPPSQFAWDSPVSDGRARWEVVENGRKAELLLEYINNKIGKIYYNSKNQHGARSSG